MKKRLLNGYGALGVQSTRVSLRVCYPSGSRPVCNVNRTAENNITGETLLECDHSVLKELGITKVGDRVRIFVAVKGLRTRAYGNGKKRNRV
jgi:mitogen-activated protein kinase kinase kinase